MTHICVGNLTIIGSDNGLSPGRRQAIIWTNAGILLFAPLGTNFSEIWIKFHTFSFKKMHFKRSSAKWRPFYLGLNVLIIADGSKDIPDMSAYCQTGRHQCCLKYQWLFWGCYLTYLCIHAYTGHFNYSQWVRWFILCMAGESMA